MSINSMSRESLTTRSRRAFIIRFATLLVILGLATPAMAEPGFHVYPESEKVQQAFDALKAKDYEVTLQNCKKIKDLSAEDQNLCHLATAVASNRTEEYKRARKAARKLIESAPKGEIAAAAHRELGLALVGKLKDDEGSWPRLKRSSRARSTLESAEAAFRRSLELSDNQSLARVALADVLTAQLVYHQKMEYEEEIREILFDYLDGRPKGPAADWARTITCTSPRYAGLRQSSEPLYSKDDAGKKLATAEVYPTGVKLADGRIVEKPKKIRTPSPKYSDLASAAGVQGVAIIQLIIDDEGKVSKLYPLKRLPLCLTEEAMLAAQDWIFEPATLDGEPVPVYYHLTINFWPSAESKERAKKNRRPQLWGAP